MKFQMSWRYDLFKKPAGSTNNQVEIRAERINVKHSARTPREQILHGPHSYEFLSKSAWFFLPALFFQPVLCEASYVLLEYVKTAMFMWMFIEGLFLHNIVTGA